MEYKSIVFVLVVLSIVLIPSGESIQDSIRANLRSKLLENTMVRSDSSWYMYVAGTAPFCAGECEQGDMILNRYLQTKEWSGDEDKYGGSCPGSFKALCATTTSARGESPWIFPACPIPSMPGECTINGKSGGTPDSWGCAGCPPGSREYGFWYDEDIACNIYGVKPSQWPRPIACKLNMS